MGKGCLFLCLRKYGEENIAAFIVHCDELNPHIHCTLLPIKDGRLRSRSSLQERTNMNTVPR